MPLLVKLLLNLLFVGMSLSIALLWTKIEKYLNKTIFKNINKNLKVVILTFATILLELIVILQVSTYFQGPVIDSFFVGSLLLLCCVWLHPYLMVADQNISKVEEKYFSGGVDLGPIKVFRPTFTPFNIGTLILSTVSIIASVVYYLPYFL
ncbi:hypothetical protein [Bacillus cereus]|uniref:Uncharacterized protein n=1 Tax=Bacillus cereus HuA4-10 TaxID=1053206 RepID=J8DI73_BACCE|nr:hypothetical protein [Bacillus cereus]EJQ75865.1 hypothetical protein IGC_04516 [Bacillus cereus HuA4-10]